MRVFLDTNVLASAFATRGLCVDVLRIVLSEHVLVLAEHVLVELERVLIKKFKLPAQTVQDVISFLRDYEVIPNPTIPCPISVRDKDDEIVLASAIVGEVDVIVTGDLDLLDLGTNSPLSIKSPREFWVSARSGIR